MKASDVIIMSDTSRSYWLCWWMVKSGQLDCGFAGVC